MRRYSRRELLQSAVALGLTAQGAFAQDVEVKAIPRQGLAARPPVKPLPDSRAVIAAADLPGRVRYALFDPAAGQMLEEYEGAVPVPPASTLKTITALYALDRLGASHRFRTRVLRSDGMLILAGGGDPVLSSDDLAGLAGDLTKAGVTSPQRFAVWGGALPRIEEIAPPQEDHLAYNPALSGMILNFNRVHLGWRRANGDYQMSLEARAARNSPRAYTVTAQAAAQSDLFSYRFDGDHEIWTVDRSAMGQAGSRWLPVRRPELYAGDVFQTLCRASGLVLPSPEVIQDIPAGEEIASHESPPLGEIVRDMLYYSTNLTAEVIGLHASSAPDLKSSAKLMRQWVETRIQPADMTLADHSGLSADSRVTAAAMTRLMAGPGLDAKLQDFLKHDPLAESVKTDTKPKAEVFAKTGTLNFVSNLAGFATTPSGRRLAFAILCSDPDRHAATQGQDLPSGVIGWTRKAKRVQYDLIENWIMRFA
ncbi:D-alanyl-D-alanine carboxypeptidase/D-alanyl-D-alanine-endopeptidase [Paracoccus onubensis]|uniref:D-alanyl-D-alanine carboxypeptidase/D-alanyl-D-alanine endopeptidase n=1 Tax=Paracoccus onubensis TaxID=1675788 RepID=UPI00272F6134|nr:D-alanyl-D-alanine carboxypeptidase/D-alanyl-D-alanine-endopeptidase [Paracoccus onubensis]MDP0927331.1 D-alanyl-D-alanine carboxypeptidase/D-alanyl-D-alanine-endopeptidase [Paracoccus onubensis]